MTPEAFCRWLQGYCEIHGGPPTAKQWECIKEHLQLCYVKVTSPPAETVPAPKKDQKSILKELGWDLTDVSPGTTRIC